MSSTLGDLAAQSASCPSIFSSFPSDFSFSISRIRSGTRRKANTLSCCHSKGDIRERHGP